MPTEEEKAGAAKANMFIWGALTGALATTITCAYCFPDDPQPAAPECPKPPDPVVELTA